MASKIFQTISGPAHDVCRTIRKCFVIGFAQSATVRLFLIMDNTSMTRSQPPDDVSTQQ